MSHGTHERTRKNVNIIYDFSVSPVVKYFIARHSRFLSNIK